MEYKFIPLDITYDEILTEKAKNFHINKFAFAKYINLLNFSVFPRNCCKNRNDYAAW